MAPQSALTDIGYNKLFIGAFNPMSFSSIMAGAHITKAPPKSSMPDGNKFVK
jgi:hypothetical protein